MKTITNATCVPDFKSVGEYIQFVIDNELLTDPGFQSSAEDTRWSDKDHSEYFLSLVTGKAPTPFILADVEQCKQHAIEFEQSRDVEYYKEWLDKGKGKNVYLNIDSFNRNFGIQDILNNKVTLPHVKIVIKGLGTWDINELNDTYETMPKTLRNHFEEQKV